MRTRSRLILTVLAVMMIMLVWMTGYELSKEFLFPHLTLWKSHLITVLFSTFLATLAAWFILRKYQALLDRLNQELEERHRAQAALQAAHGELEKRVQERTAALVKANEELQGEIRERYRAEEAMRASESKYRELVQNANSIILRMKPQGEITFFNEFAQRFFGYTEAEILGRSIVGTIVPATDTAGHDLAAMIREIGQHPERFTNNENENMRRNGDRVWIAWTNKGIVDEQGAITEILCVGNDITARRQAEAALAQKTAALERSNADLEQFAYIVSHDLQAPLTVIAGFAELLARRYQGQLDDKAEGFITQIQEGVRRQQHLINDLLEYSRVTTRGKEFEPVDCNTVVDQVLRDLSLLIQEKGAVVIHDPLPTVMADASQLGRVFQNLIGNALKFCQEGTPQVQVGAEPGHQEWRFWVRDNGIGIAAKDFDRIFMMFERLHDRSEYPGTGIGLAICQKIVERHGGRIWVESEPGCGSTFWFTLPAREPAPTARRGGTDAGAVQGRGLTREP
jgi:PAS domain S-box-containing protein